MKNASKGENKDNKNILKMGDGGGGGGTKPSRFAPSVGFKSLNTETF